MSPPLSAHIWKRRSLPPNKRLQLTPSSSFQSICGMVLAAGAAVSALPVGSFWCSGAPSRETAPPRPGRRRSKPFKFRSGMSIFPHGFGRSASAPSIVDSCRRE